MQATVTNIDVRELDSIDIMDEYNERMSPADGADWGDDEPCDEPTPAQMPYYSLYGHRVHLDLLDAAGEHTSMEPTEQNLAVLSSIENEVNAAIVAAGADTAETGWRFSQFAGCGMCPCSPGFIVGGRGHRKQVFVTVQVHTANVVAA